MPPKSLRSPGPVKREFVIKFDPDTGPYANRYFNVEMADQAEAAAEADTEGKDFAYPACDLKQATRFDSVDAARGELFYRGISAAEVYELRDGQEIMASRPALEQQAEQLVAAAVERARQIRESPAPQFQPKTPEEITALVQQHLAKIHDVIGANLPPDRQVNGKLQLDQAEYRESEGSLAIPTDTGSEIVVMVVEKGAITPDDQDYNSPEWREFDFNMDLSQVIDISPTEIMVISQS